MTKTDIIWTAGDTIDFENLKPGQMTNQCENERCITFKNSLAATVMRAFGDVSSPSSLIGYYYYD